MKRTRYLALLLLAVLLLNAGAMAACTDPSTRTLCDDEGHDYNTTDWAYDVTAHYHKCNRDGCTAKIDWSEHDSDEECGKCGYKRSVYSKEYAREGNAVTFGSYPQSQVEDAELIASLNELAGEQAAEADRISWIAYPYYKNGEQADFMWYQDVTYENNRYRGVYFSEYRPHHTSYDSSANVSNQDDNGYTADEVYWFKYEPIRWTILEWAGDKVLLLCNTILDAQTYQNAASLPSSIPTNEYASSTIRAWLNNDFLNTAFTSAQKLLIAETELDNSKNTAGVSPSGDHTYSSSKDRVFLPSYADVTNTEYGFASDENRRKLTTDYAQMQGAYTAREGDFAGMGWWWLRSYSDNASDAVRVVYYKGGIGTQGADVRGTDEGVVPALWLKIN